MSLRFKTLWGWLPYPFLVFFCIGVFLAGFPFILPDSLSVQVLPEGTKQIWEGSYALGGVSTAIGLLTRRPGFEAAGLMLMGVPFAVQAFLSIEVIGLPGIRSALFLACIALGCFTRFVMIIHRTREHQDDLVVQALKATRDD